MAEGRFGHMAAAGFLLPAALLAPVLAAKGFVSASALLYLFFAPLCHQIPDRSFELAGFAMAVCHRCCGLYTGLAAAACFPNAALRPLERPAVRRMAVLAAAVLLCLDAGLPYLGWWENTAWTRWTTGLFLGTVFSALLRLGLSSLGRGRGLRKYRCATREFEGDLG
jgi:uncharacterized membrane protein